MTTIEQLFEEHIKQRTRNERLALLKLLTDSLGSQSKRSNHTLSSGHRGRRRRSVLEILNETPGQRLFQTADDVDFYLSQERLSWGS